MMKQRREALDAQQRLDRSLARVISRQDRRAVARYLALGADPCGVIVLEGKPTTPLHCAFKLLGIPRPYGRPFDILRLLNLYLSARKELAEYYRTMAIYDSFLHHHVRPHKDEPCYAQYCIIHSARHCFYKPPIPVALQQSYLCTTIEAPKK